jgi:ABC-type sugar transport system ATPase subunit
MPTQENNQEVLRVENLTKKFIGILANDNSSLTFNRHEIHSLCGENGAGKSTFCKMLTGVYHPDEGKIFVNGKEIQFQAPADSLAAGISMVYQERNLVGHLTGAQNICLGHEPRKGGLIDEKAIAAKAEEIRSRLGIEIPLDVPVEELGAGQQQIIEIIRAFYGNPSVLILDEPTASLGEGEVEPFLDFIRSLRDDLGMAILFISHKLEEVYAISDVITVFADGRHILTSPKDKLSQDECVKAMIRADRQKTIVVPKKDFTNAEVVLEAREVSYDGKKHHVPMKVRKGEAVGFYGLVGSGRTETMETIGGIRLSDGMDVTFAGERITKTEPVQMIHRGFILTAEKRINGAFPGLSVEDNICNLFIDKLSSKAGFMYVEKMLAFAKKILDKNEVKYTSIDQNITELSGGNIQKVIIGRSIELDNLRLLVLDEPTAGMDLGAKSEVYVKIRHLVDDESKSVIFISSELDELLTTCDELCVFYDGDIVAQYSREEFNKEQILADAMGGRKGEKT